MRITKDLLFFLIFYHFQFLFILINILYSFFENLHVYSAHLEHIHPLIAHIPQAL